MQILANGKVRRTEAEWKDIIGRWEKSGLKPRPFCRREQIQLSSFLRWQRKGLPADAAKDFVTVTPARRTSASSWTVEISLPNGCQLRIQG